ncbi:MAG: hypothetical protein HYW25_03565 [Candidatus Aenigmarchaeota archaeon]|nr:hypothetical protein [Candidatus Aenigmarchaeota archaeon]
MEKGAEIAIGITILVVILMVAFLLFGAYSLAAKMLGILLIIIAVFLIAYFPGATEIQEPILGKTGIIIGIAMFLIGIFLIFFI